MGIEIERKMDSWKTQRDERRGALLSESEKISEYTPNFGTNYEL